MKAFLLLLLSFSIIGCQEKSSLSGEKLFNQVHIGKNNVVGCISCHSLKPDIATVGPSLYKLGLRADLLVKGLTAKQYIKQSIINPDAYIVSGYSPATMFAHYQNELTEAEIQALVDFLLIQK